MNSKDRCDFGILAATLNRKADELELTFKGTTRNREQKIKAQARLDIYREISSQLMSILKKQNHREN